MFFTSGEVRSITKNEAIKDTYIAHKAKVKLQNYSILLQEKYFCCLYFCLIFSWIKADIKRKKTL